MRIKEGLIKSPMSFSRTRESIFRAWIPAFAGMTKPDRLLNQRFLKFVLFLGLLQVSLLLIVLSASARTNRARANLGASDRSLILRQYPEAGAIEVPTCTQIGITALRPFESDLPSGGGFTVIGSRSGRHEGRTELSYDRTTIIFHPLKPFDLNETVNVQLSAASEAAGESSYSIISDTFSFSTMSRYVAPLTPAELADYRGEKSLWPAEMSAPANTSKNNRNSEVDDRSSTKPLELPYITVTVDSLATPGKILLGTFGGAFPESYVMVLDQDGYIRQNKSVPPGPGLLFCYQPNGEYTYIDALNVGFIGLDSNLNAVDTFRTANGYQPDGHELLVPMGGGYTILAISHTPQRDVGITGNDTTADVIGSVIQTFDKDRKLIFEWRGIDSNHYSVRDAMHEDMRGHNIDFEHANSIDIDDAGNYLLSNRSLSEISKINGKTKEFIWRFGGKHNQFQMLSDTLGFSYQHDAKWVRPIAHSLPHILLFDNGNYHAVPESRAVEYELDESSLTAKQVWQHRHVPAVYAVAMGSAQRLPNGNTFIGWGLARGVTASEVTPDDSVVFEMQLQDHVFSYRAPKVPAPEARAVARYAPAALALSVKETADGTDLLFSTPGSGQTSLVLCDLLGRIVTRLFDGVTSSTQTFRVHLATTALPSGVYYAALKSAGGAGGPINGTRSLVQPVVVRR